MIFEQVSHMAVVAGPGKLRKCRKIKIVKISHYVWFVTGIWLHHQAHKHYYLHFVQVPRWSYLILSYSHILIVATLFAQHGQTLHPLFICTLLVITSSLPIHIRPCLPRSPTRGTPLHHGKTRSSRQTKKRTHLDGLSDQISPRNQREAEAKEGGKNRIKGNGHKNEGDKWLCNDVAHHSFFLQFPY